MLHWSYIHANELQEILPTINIVLIPSSNLRLLYICFEIPDTPKTIYVPIIFTVIVPITVRCFSDESLDIIAMADE